jgi:hypothetical protein
VTQAAAVGDGGANRILLQVETGNTPARALYAAAVSGTRTVIITG